MSGVKCGEIRLEDTIRNAITAVFAQSAATATAVASAAALEAEHAELVSAAKRMLDAAVESEHRATLERFVADADRLHDAAAALRERRRTLDGLRTEPELTPATLSQVSAAGRDCEASAATVRGLEADLRAQTSDVERALRIEQRGEAFRLDRCTRQLRGLLAEIDDRLQSTVSSLTPVSRDARRLRQEVSAGLAGGGRDETEIATFRTTLDKLIVEASELEQGASEQRATHHRLMRAFETAGYSLVPGTEVVPDDYQSAARSLQQGQGDQSEITAQTEVHRDGELHLTMLGPSGAAAAHVIECDSGCDERLQRLIKAASDHGITIKNVAPVPGHDDTEDSSQRVVDRCQTAS